jgi:ligand-binding sensor domain-containing protein
MTLCLATKNTGFLFYSYHPVAELYQTINPGCIELFLKDFQSMKQLIFIHFILAAASLFAGDFENFDASNSGLSDNVVNAIVIDANGNKWFGTENGLSAFDGVNWITYKSDENQQTLADNDINDLAFELGSFGPELWLATSNGASVLGIEAIDAVTKATPYRTDNTDLIDNIVTAVAVDTARGERWFGTPKGVSRFSSSGWQNFSTDTNSPLAWNDVTAIGVDADSGWKYICTQNGVEEMNGVARLRSTPGDVDAVTAPSPYNVEWSKLNSRNINAVFVEAHGAQWFGTDAGLAYHDTTETKKKWNVFTENEGLANNKVNALFKSDNGIVWIGTEGGLDRLDYQLGENGIESYKFLNFTTAQGLVDNHVNDIAQDLDGTLWIATNNGVSHFSGKTNIANKTDDLAAKSFGLVDNYPNPFNPTTSITYNLESGAHVELYIINMRGKRIRTLVSTNQTGGVHETTWDGRFSNGQKASTGIYIAILDATNSNGVIRDSIKMLLAK